MSEQYMKPNKIVKKLALLITHHPWKCLLGSLIVVFLILPSLKKLQADFDVRIWFLETDPMIVSLNKFERQFGNDENVVLYIQSPSGIFDKESIALIQEITQKMWLLPDVIRVDSITNFNWTHAQGDDIIVEPFFEQGVELTDELLKQREQIALNHKVLPNYLIGPKGKQALIFANLKPTLEGSPNYKVVIDGVKELIKKYKGYTDHKFYFTGQAAINDGFREVSESDLKKILPLVLLLVAVFMLYSFRSLKAMIYPFGVIFLSIGSTLGIAALIGIKYNNMTSMLPGILIAIGVADSVHVIVTYFQFLGEGKDKKEAAYLSLLKNILPTLITSITTMVGFFSLSTAGLLPIRHLGILAGIGTLIAWLLTIFFLGPLLTLITVQPLKKSAPQYKFPEISPFSQKFMEVIKKYSLTIVVSFSLLTGLSLILTVKNKVDSNPFDYFNKGVQVRDANDYILDNFGGSNGPQIVIETSREDGVKDPKFLKKVDKYIEWIKTLPYVTKVSSIVDVLKQTHRSLHGDREDYYVLSDSQQSIAEELFLYTMGLPQGMDLNNQVTIKNDALRVNVQWTIRGSVYFLEEAKKLEAKAKELNLDAKLAGKMPIYMNMNGHIVDTFIWSMSMAIILVSIIMILVFRSLKVGFLSMLPNFIPLIFGGSLLYVLGKDINVGTALVTSVCLGIAVDDTVHFITNFVKYIKQGMPPDKAIATVFTYTGRALIVTTIVLVAGFGMFVIGDFEPNINFGILTALILIVALFVDLIFLPAMLMLPLRNKTSEKNMIKELSKDPV